MPLWVLGPWSHCELDVAAGKLRDTMNRTRRSLVLAATIGAALSPSAALAKGGGSTPPSAAPTPVVCDSSQDGYDAQGAYVSTSGVSDAGCVTQGFQGQTLRLLGVAPAPGWTYVVNSGGGTKGRIDVTFTNTATGARVGLRSEPGKTVVTDSRV